MGQEGIAYFANELKAFFYRLATDDEIVELPEFVAPGEGVLVGPFNEALLNYANLPDLSAFYDQWDPSYDVLHSSNNTVDLLDVILQDAGQNPVLTHSYFVDHGGDLEMLNDLITTHDPLLDIRDYLRYFNLSPDQIVSAAPVLRKQEIGL